MSESQAQRDAVRKAARASVEARRRRAEEKREREERRARGDRERIARELADNVYAAYGTAHVYGIDLDVALAEIHRSAMRKLAANVRRADGKVIKPPGFVPPDMSGAVTARPSPVPGGCVHCSCTRRRGEVSLDGGKTWHEPSAGPERSPYGTAVQAVRDAGIGAPAAETTTEGGS